LDRVEIAHTGSGGAIGTEAAAVATGCADHHALG
jgi:hypothetical protein